MKLFVPIILTIFLFRCSEKKDSKESPIESNTEIAERIDTITGTKEITDELAGSNYRKRAKGYFLIVKNDTSDFMPVFMEAKEGGKVSLDLRFQESKSYGNQYNEFKKILPSASKDFILDSLSSIAIGSLVSTGDLAIEISKQAKDSGVLNKKPLDYKKLSSFLTESKLGEDFNSLLKPYNLVVSGVSIEKAFLMNSSYLHGHGKIETDSTTFPDKILDCITWIKIKPINSK